ncbi:MAG TPA: Hsp70 family protein [Kofleriaceae bacterium]|nr:Hsp70 family protein [Kofleriaceae bacterium]
MSFKVGIDLGTTNSVVAYMKAGRPAVPRTLEGIDWTPSVVQSLGGKLIVGKRARDNLAEAPQGTVAWSVKRFIGRMPNDDNVKRARQLVSYTVEPPAPGGEELVIKLAGKPLTPVELSAEILKHIVAGVEKSLRQRPTHAVITVPAYFTERQKAATQKAGELAGLGVLGILDEPTAAALAYGIDLGTESRTVMVFDLGGGTFDVSVLMLSSLHSLQFRIGGDNFLGGDDFDNIVLTRLLDELPAAIRREPAVIAQLKSVAEDAKIALSTTETIAIDKFLRTPGGGQPIAISTEITRAWFQQASRPLVERAIQCVHDVLAGAKLGADRIDRVLMVGGSSRLPAVVDAVSAVFGAHKIDADIDGMLCVALGAAIRASQLEPAAAGKPAVERDPVDHGGSVVVTVTPRPIGVELADGTLSVLIPEGTVLPAEPRLHPYSTARPGQTEVRLRFYEGHQPLARHNDHINDVVITLTKPVPKSTPVDITFSLDRNGIATLSVAIADKLLLKDARIERAIPIDQLPPPEPPQFTEPSLDDVQYRMSRILDVCRPILDHYPTFRDTWRAAIAAIETAPDPAARRRALEAGKRMLDAGLPAHLWAYYNGHMMKAPSAEEQRAIDSHLRRAGEAANAHDLPRMHNELDHLHSEIQGQWDRTQAPTKGPGGIVER